MEERWFIRAGEAVHKRGARCAVEQRTRKLVEKNKPYSTLVLVLVL